MVYSYTNSKGTIYILHSKDVTLREEEIKRFITFLKAKEQTLVTFHLEKR